MIRNRFGSRPSPCSGVRRVRSRRVVLVAIVASACGQASEPEVAHGPNPLQVLASRLSHGIGDDALDSELARDSLNAAILLRARRGVTSSELGAHIPDVDRRLATLAERGLLRETTDGFRTAFPILLGAEAREYRRLTAGVASNLLAELTPQLERLIAEVEGRGWGAWTYHFVWSQIFDSQFAWVEMVERGLVPPLAPPVAWVVFPTHPFMSGTNYYPDDRLDTHFLALTWTPRGRAAIDIVGGNWAPIYRTALAGRAEPSDMRLMRRLGLLDAHGGSRIPVVNGRDSLYLLLRQTSHRVIEILSEELDLAALMRETLAGPEISWAMAYHDIAWDVLRRLVEDGFISRPPLLAGSTAVGPDDSVDVRGTSAVIEAYAPFHELIRRALAGD